MPAPGVGHVIGPVAATPAVSDRVGSALAAALTPLSAGIVIATLALVAYDGLLTRIEKLAGALDRLGAETIDAIALTAPISSPRSRSARSRRDRPLRSRRPLMIDRHAPARLIDQPLLRSRFRDRRAAMMSRPSRRSLATAVIDRLSVTTRHRAGRNPRTVPL